MIRSLRNIARLLGIARILARHDALFLLERLDVVPAFVTLAARLARRSAPGRPGERLARALEQAGPTFIKLGQALSTRSDLLGEEMAEDLSKLQDSLPPFPTPAAKAAIEAEFNQPVDVLFKSFDETAVAAASIAQVHFAVTPDGRKVAVKVLRPDIEAAFEQDMELLLWLAHMVEATRPEMRRLKPVETVETLAQSVLLEMDLRFEAAAAAELGDNFKGDDSFHVPQVDWIRTGKRVLTTERVSGIPIDDIAAIRKAGFDGGDILAKSAAAFFRQVFRDGFFHADMHPGNMFVLMDGTLAPVDFGIMGRLDKATRKHLAELLLAFLNRDYRRAAEVHFEAGWIKPNQSVDHFTQACRSIAEPILDLPQNEISIGRLLGQLFQITETFEMETQPQLLMLQKTMLVAEGTGRILQPQANMWVLSRPLIEEWMIANLGPEARLRDGATEALDAIRRLPGLLLSLERATRQFSEGGLRLHPDTVDALRSRKGAMRPGPFSLIKTAALIISTLFLGGFAGYLIFGM